MRYTGNTELQKQEMLRVCGRDSVDEFFDVIPKDVRADSIDIDPGKSEIEVENILKAHARKNNPDLICFTGAGVYDHYVPSAIDALVSRSEFYTAYTPYQPELSQGTLQSIYEYQTEIARLTGMDVSNASLYDGGTALYEACSLASAVSKKKNRIVVDRCVNPIYRRILKTYTNNLDIEIIETGNGIRADREAIKSELDKDTAGLIIQNPSFFGVIDDHSDLAEVCHSNKTLMIESVNPLSLRRLKTPAEMGADICIGEGQPFGIPLSFGGPFLGFIACSKKLARKLPGRISGRTLDREGKEGFVLTLQAREQHIRREKATSNICTNQALCALRAHIYLTLTGKEGLNEVFTQSHIKAEYAKKQLSNIKGIEIPEDGPTFNEFRMELPMDAEAAVNEMIKHGYAAGFPLGFYYPDFRNSLLIAVTEKRTAEEIDQFANTLKEIL